VPAGANNSQFKIVDVFPNPSDRFVNVKLSKKIAKACLVITSAEGYIIQKKEVIDQDNLTLDVSKYTPGVYFVRLVDDKFYTEPIKVVVL
jgi:Secretion system C-terminal sorting domain